LSKDRDRWHPCSEIDVFSIQDTAQVMRFIEPDFRAVGEDLANVGSVIATMRDD